MTAACKNVIRTASQKIIVKRCNYLQFEHAVERGYTPKARARIVRVDVVHGNVAALLRLKLLLQPRDFSCEGVTLPRVAELHLGEKE